MKRTITLLTALVAVCALAGCGEEKGQPLPPDAKDAMSAPPGSRPMPPQAGEAMKAAGGNAAGPPPAAR